MATAQASPQPVPDNLDWPIYTSRQEASMGAQGAIYVVLFSNEPYLTLTTTCENLIKEKKGTSGV